MNNARHSGPGGAALSEGLTTGGVCMPVVKPSSGRLITGGVTVERTSTVVVRMASDLALFNPTVLFLPSTVTTVAKSKALPAARLTRPPPTFDRPRFEPENPRSPLTGVVAACANKAIWTATWPRLAAWT